MNRPHPFRCAFTYVELLALLAISAILLSIFVPFLAAENEKERRIVCEDHLRQLGDALEQYADRYNNEYPRTRYDPVLNPNGYTAFTGPDIRNPNSIAVGPNDVTAPLWLLVRGGFIKDMTVFICPSRGGEPDRLDGADHRSNFRSPRNLSYSYADPYSGFTQYRLNSDYIRGQFALMADRNPGADAASVPHDASPLELARANSRNHGRAGQNVLYADGTVSFQTTPYCGVRPKAAPDGDNIYTALSDQPLTGDTPFYAGNGYVGTQYGPAYQWDSYLVPTDDDLP